MIYFKRRLKIKKDGEIDHFPTSGKVYDTYFRRDLLIVKG